MVWLIDINLDKDKKEKIKETIHKYSHLLSTVFPFLSKMLKKGNFKGTVVGILSEFPFKEGNAQFTTVLLKQ